MTNYSLRARMMILILAPTVLIGLLLSIFFVVHRYNDLQRQLEDAGASIIEPLAVSTEYGMSLQNRESIGQLISVLHRRHSDIVRAISVYDENNRLFVTSNFHLDPSSMQLGSNVPFPRQLTVTRDGDIMILRTPIISESYSPDESPSSCNFAFFSGLISAQFWAGRAQPKSPELGANLLVMFPVFHSQQQTTGERIIAA